ncbi:MAG: type II toxin-antitoxin system Phd/YefM family antitoxin [Deltaproteobacteria bacterium]|nr:type II toxin-antitoxin system Phd/YefM family antitoxin [Deltaproteobacteria bacterium]
MRLREVDTSVVMVPAGQFKQGCLAILDEVAATRRPVIITKRGRPVARLVPIEPEADAEARILADLRSRMTLLVDDDALLEPIDVAWEAEGAPADAP